MELKKGYKKTDIGVIPEDWECLKVEDCVSITTGKKNTDDNIADGLYSFFVRSQQVEKINSFSFNCEAVLTAGDGVGTGRIFHYINGKFDVHQRVYVMTNFRNVTGKFFYFYFSSYFYNEVSKYTAKSSVDSVRKDMIAKMSLLTPPIPEQHAIASALSDIDNLIDVLNKLIDKKKNIKQGAIQELLTRKKRLDGFSREWKTINLGEILEIGHGKSQHEILDLNGKYPILATSGEIGRTNMFLYDKPSVLIGRKGTINKPQYINTPFWTIDTLFYTKIHDSVHPKYLYYLFCTIDWLLYNEASGVPSLNSKTIESIEVYIPILEEQTAIANILSDMDAEIEALEQKLNKYKSIKQGMMQELLTGRIRLV
ncbi:MAG: restriction endonuclease subunit S [Ruminiclostridium sp.]|nr:restriction endonuclease subunit S [Ruminiclostridium sp.]